MYNVVHMLTAQPSTYVHFCFWQRSVMLKAEPSTYGRFFPATAFFCCSLSFWGFWIHPCEYRKYLDLHGLPDISIWCFQKQIAQTQLQLRWYEWSFNFNFTRPPPPGKVKKNQSCLKWHEMAWNGEKIGRKWFLNF